MNTSRTLSTAAAFLFAVSAGRSGGSKRPDAHGQSLDDSGPAATDPGADDQPLMATGVDLNGPPTGLPPSKTSE